MQAKQKNHEFITHTSVNPQRQRRLTRDEFVARKTAEVNAILSRIVFLPQTIKRLKSI